jgi:molecular chaperone DnaK
MAEIAVGIDLGTSNSCVAVSRRGRADVLPNAYGESTTASVVNLASDGSITVGNAAKANIIHDPHNTVYSAKRLIGRYYFSEEVKKAQAICSYEIVEGENHSVRIKVREEVFTLPEMGAMVLRELKSIAESRLGRPVSKAVLTVPAYFNDNQRQATKDAARIAGLEVLRVLNEPTAAALAYGFGKGLNQRVAVYDLGGGTFDISVLEIGEDVFEVLATSGDTFLGGDDFDDRLIDLLADEFTAREGINLRNDPYALEKLKVAAETAKKGLSMDDEVEIRIPDVITGPDGSPRSVERRLATDEFTTLVMDLIQRTFKVCDEALQHAGLVARDVDGVILVGGPTRLPVIRNAVKEYFGKEPKTDVDPDEVVALGAALHAASLVNQGGEAYLLDVTPLSLQIGVAGGLSETVIDRNTPVPIEQTRTFTTFQDHQESVTIRVYQGESRESAENELLGQFEFSGFNKGRRGEVEIDVTFEINTDGIVNVTARDRGTGEEASTRITLSSGLSEPELQDILERGVADRVTTAVPDDQEIVPLETDAEDDPFTPIETDADDEVALDTRVATPAPTPDPGAEDPSLTSHSKEVPLENITEEVSREESPPAPKPATPARDPREIETQVDFERGDGAAEIELDSPVPELDIDAIDDDDAILDEITPEVAEQAPARSEEEEPYSLFDEPLTDLSSEDPEKQG